MSDSVLRPPYRHPERRPPLRLYPSLLLQHPLATSDHKERTGLALDKSTPISVHPVGSWLPRLPPPSSASLSNTIPQQYYLRQIHTGTAGVDRGQVGRQGQAQVVVAPEAAGAGSAVFELAEQATETEQVVDLPHSHSSA